jgi:hypothetical protein
MVGKIICLPQNYHFGRGRIAVDLNVAAHQPQTGIAEESPLELMSTAQPGQYSVTIALAYSIGGSRTQLTTRLSASSAYVVPFEAAIDRAPTMPFTEIGTFVVSVTLRLRLAPQQSTRPPLTMAQVLSLDAEIRVASLIPTTETGVTASYPGGTTTTQMSAVQSDGGAGHIGAPLPSCPKGYQPQQLICPDECNAQA